MNPKVAAALALAKDPAGFAAVRQEAAKRLPGYPRNGCAATLSTLLAAAGINVPFTVNAEALADILEWRGWRRVSRLLPMAGDVAVTADANGNAMADHIFLILSPQSADVMLIVDNQAKKPHRRSLSGADGRTPTEYLLRAPD